MRDNILLMRVCLIFLMSLVCSAVARAEFIWLEAEQPTAANFPAKNPFAANDDIEKSRLSGGEWIGIEGRRAAPTFASYQFNVENAGAHSVFARKFWKHGPFKWRIDDGDWKSVGKDVGLIDRVQIRKNVEVNWIALGSVELSAGAHTLQIELTDNFGPAAFDCFVITNQPFTPRGKLRPGEKIGAAPAGWFAFEPDEDPFGESPIDLRYLNEKFAGENGRLIARGDAIVHEKTGEVVRLWGVNARPEIVNFDPVMLDNLAKFLAKRGVNVLRIHMPVGDVRGADDRAIASVQRCVSAMKKQGIYTVISIYFPLWIKLNEKDGFGAYKDQHPFGLVFFDPQYQAVYRNWFQQLLTRPNPNDNDTPLCDDPAVAMVEMVNEDSLLFWTMKPYENIPAEPMAKLEAQFGAWAEKKYGSIDAALAKWSGQSVRGDNAGEKRLGILTLWEIINRKSPRGADTAVFLADTQRTFYTEMQSFLRDSCRYNGITIASNWITADGKLLGPLDKESNTVADVMDRHGYFGGKHEGPRSSYMIDPGDKYNDRAAVRFDRQEGFDASRRSIGTPIFDMQYDGKPSINSELNWTPPNRFRAEMPLLAAAYGALQGTDGFMFFALNAPSWDGMLTKFSLQTPTVIGQFPAAALAYRRGMIAPGNAVTATLGREDLHALRGGIAQTALDLDQLREKDIPTDAESSPTIDPLTFTSGAVAVKFADGRSATNQRDLSQLIDREKGIVKSVTGELTCDYGRGVVSINAEKVQAATGFLGAAGKIELKDCTFEVKNEYAAVWLIALDDQPLATSKKMLLQVVTEESNNGFTTTGEPTKTITATGAAPIVVRNIEGTVSLRSPAARVTTLDANGYAAKPATGGPAISLQSNALYYLIER